MMSFGAMQDKIESMTVNVEALDESRKTVEDQIQAYIKNLNIYADARSKINSLKMEKDCLVKQYIEKTKQPKRLDFNLLNYKALLFYFIEKFISDNDSPLRIENYKNKLNNTEFFNIFSADKTIYIHTKYTNFPHLIGYKNDDEVMKDTNKQFLEKIFYETNLISDYSIHGCKLPKIETFSWIWKTLMCPLYIFKGDAIKEGSRLEGDVIFVSKRVEWNTSKTEKKAIYHYVSLVNINKEKNIYVINSHHPQNTNEFNLQFNINKKIYEFDFS